MKPLIFTIKYLLEEALVQELNFGDGFGFKLLSKIRLMGGKVKGSRGLQCGFGHCWRSSLSEGPPLGERN